MSMTKWYSDDIIDVYMEDSMNLPIVHCIVHNWSKEAALHISAVWKELCISFKEQGLTEVYATIPTDDEKLQRFASWYGMIPTPVLASRETGDELIWMKEI